MIPGVSHPLRGTPLRDADLSRGAVSLEHWDPALAYRWDTGVAIGRFLEGLRQGKILGIRCRRCARTVTPPRAFCEICFLPMDEWVELADTATVNTFSICFITWDMRPLRIPQVPAVIEIDGTSPRVGFLHLLGGLRGRTVERIRREVRMGLPVRAVWKPVGQRSGAITDILHFAPQRRRS
jgi:hypothetical protein